MILRRVIKHFRNQEWIPIGIDFVIVVFGVFMGIQVANWNQAQSDKSLGEKFTQRLTADLLVEKFNYATLIEYLSDVQANADKALASLEGDIVLSDEQLLIAAYRATQFNAGIHQRTTYDELIATGKISLITDQTLVNTASLVYTTKIFDLMTDEGINSAYRMTFRKSLAVAIQVGISQQCGDRFVEIGDFTGIKNQLDYACKTELSPAKIEQAAQVLKSSPAILEDLRLRAMNVRTQYSNLIFSNQDILEALQQLSDDNIARNTTD